MDDISVASINKSNPVQKMIQEDDNAPNKGNFQVKQWTKTRDTGPVKFFSYMYHSQFDTFDVHLALKTSVLRRKSTNSGNVIMTMIVVTALMKAKTAKMPIENAMKQLNSLVQTPNVFP